MYVLKFKSDEKFSNVENLLASSMNFNLWTQQLWTTTATTILPYFGREQVDCHIKRLEDFDGNEMVLDAPAFRSAVQDRNGYVVAHLDERVSK